MPYKNIEDAKAHKKEYYKKNRDKIIKKQKEYYEKTIEDRKEYEAKRYKRDKKKRIAKNIEYQRKMYPVRKKKLNTVRPLDVLYSKIIRARDGKCLHCGKTESLQCSHVLPRTFMSVRWDLDNAITLCFRCHIYWWHKYPHEAVAWYDTLYPGRYEDLRRVANQHIKVDRTEKFEQLKKIAKKEGIK